MFYINKMNLLDQLANFCPNPVSINLLDSPQKDAKGHGRGTRHCSVFASHKNHDNRQTKSIQKLQTWVPSNKQQLKQKILFKLARTLQKKARRYYSQFWLNWEQSLKNNTNIKENISIGFQKIKFFVQAFDAKYYQGPGLTQAFSQLHKFYINKSVSICIQNSIQPVIERNQKAFLAAFNSNDKNNLKMELFMDSMDIIMNKFKAQAFYLVNHYDFSQQNLNKTLLKRKSTQNSQSINNQSLIKLSKKISILNNKLKKPNVDLKTEALELNFNCPIQHNQFIVKTFTKMQIDKVIQSCPEICDNNLLFIEQPKYKLNSESQHQIGLQNSKIQSSYCLTKRNLPKVQTKSQLFDSSISKNQINLVETQLTMKKQYSTPRNRAISTSSIFNVDETRIQKLQRKLFGQSSKKQNRFSVNGEDWKNDRKALVQIISNIKSPERLRRNSAYQVQLENCRGQIQLYPLQSQRKRLKNYALEECQSPTSHRTKNKILLKALLGQQANQKLKSEPKIVVSIKSKRRQDNGLNNISNLKQKQMKKSNCNLDSSKRIGIVCQR